MQAGDRLHLDPAARAMQRIEAAVERPFQINQIQLQIPLGDSVEPERELILSRNPQFFCELQIIRRRQPQDSFMRWKWRLFGSFPRGMTVGSSRAAPQNFQD